MTERGVLRGLHVCDDCGARLVPGVVERDGGFLVITSCKCGPYSTDTTLFPERLDATRALSGLLGKPAGRRPQKSSVRSTRRTREYQDLIGEHKARRKVAA